MKRIAKLGFVLALLTGPVGCVAHAQTTKCRPADGVSQMLILHLQDMMTTTDPDVISARDNAFRVPVVSVSQITLVTDARTCDKAATAYGPPPGSTVTPAVYVVKLGSKGYAVLDPNQRAGQFQMVKIFDTKWVLLGGWTG
jgi:hypothetical protein